MVATKTKNDRTTALCACKDCPTYREQSLFEKGLGFCHTGQASLNMISEDCLCDGCPVEPETEQRQVFYCEA